MGCYYSMCAPMFFFQFLTNKEILGKRIRVDAYLKDNYSLLISPLKRFMSNSLFKEKDRDYILGLVKDEWDVLQRGKKELCLLGIPRKSILTNEVPLVKYLGLKEDIFDVIDRILSSKYNNIDVSQMIPSDQIQMITFPHYYERISDISKKVDKKKSKENIQDINGYVSILFLLGSLSISIGVILLIISDIGG